MTADELLTMPHNGYRCELVQGKLRQMAPAGRQHGRIAAKIGSCLGACVATKGLGETHAAETGFIIDTAPDTVRFVESCGAIKGRTDTPHQGSAQSSTEKGIGTSNAALLKEEGLGGAGIRCGHDYFFQLAQPR